MASGSKGSGFGSDDILCSYEEYVEEENSNGRRSDPAIGINSTKEFHKNRTAMFPSSYSPPVEPSDEDVAVVVENTVKKYTDNLMRFLEGISSRLSQLELYCYNLDKTIGQMRSDIVRDNEEADIKLKSLEKHVQEVHRSVQILRDKQELADNQKELTKLQIDQKGSTSSTHSQHSEDRAAPQASDTKETDDPPNVHNQQLALALPHQVAPQLSAPSRPLEQHHQAVVPLPPTVPQNVMQPQAYYPPSTPMPHSPAPTPQSQVQYAPSDSQYQVPQPQDFSRMPPQSTQTQVNQPPQTHQVPQYQQQWPLQLPPHQVQQSQARAPSTAPYPPYLPSQPTNPEVLPGSVQMQMPMLGMHQPGASRSEAAPYGYGGTGAPGQPHPSLQQMKPGYGMQHGDGYTTTGTRPTPLSQGNAYMMYESDGGRGQHSFQPPHFPHGGYPPSSVPLNQQHSASTVMVRPPQFGRDHPYNDLIEKLVSMGYRGDHVVTVIQRMDESGEAVDFNAVLDRLNVNSSGGPQRRG